MPLPSPEAISSPQPTKKINELRAQSQGSKLVGRVCKPWSLLLELVGLHLGGLSSRSAFQSPLLELFSG
jgi:hypothetical protein